MATTATTVWTFENVVDKSPPPPEALVTRNDVLVKWLAKMFLAEHEAEASEEQLQENKDERGVINATR